ncbi:hypothetical protein [Bradyrhizobium sp. AUGA SZCCT0182]|uniref:hypothetical protein n=1 Tax=Bradyrhizobium sp. AUGA SZCCT0182 TaxID=2807667 RepID=UPI001BA7B8D8|nr:hypothetical protein [Bradyrhizobium sp. AUGA SZCCT0182]MBR1237564.1 hypothetical protein [Bradyrhizobium sp. AUGA SZCCT0182]
MIAHRDVESIKERKVDHEFESERQESAGDGRLKRHRDGIATAFAAEGAELILVSRDIDEGEASKKVGRPITAVNLDLSQQGAAEQLGGRFPESTSWSTTLARFPAGRCSTSTKRGGALGGT